jgi:hypothetical protein
MTAAFPWKTFLNNLTARVRSTVFVKRPARALALKETLSLGEKRFVAVIECDGRRMLVGGGAQSVELIANLDALPERD